MTNDFWSYESKDTYNAKQAQTWANKAKADAFSYLAPGQVGVPAEAVSQSPDNIFAPSPLITKKDTKGKDSGGLFKGIEDVGKGIYDVTLKPINRVLEAEHNAIARPISKLLLSPFGDYNHLPGIVKLGVETLADPLTYIGPGEVMKAFKLAKIAPELKLGAPAIQALFDSPGSRRVFSHVIQQGGLGLAAVGGSVAAQKLGAPGIVGGIAGVALAGKALNKLNPEDVSAGIKPSTADDLRTSMESAWSKGRQAGHIDASQAANAERLSKLGTEDDLMQRMYDQTEMLQLKKKIDAGDATDEELNRAGELLHKADTLKALESQRSIGGGAPGKSVPMQEMMDRYVNASPEAQKLYHAVNDMEVDATTNSRRSASQWMRNNVGDFLSKSEFGTNLKNYLERSGLRLQDTNVTPYINEWGRFGYQGQNFGAAFADHVDSVLNKGNNDGTLLTSYMKQNGTIITSEDIRNQARMLMVEHPELNLLNADGSMKLSTLVNNAGLFTNLTPEQRALIDTLAAPMKSHQELEGVFGVEGSGPLAHDEPLSDKGYVRKGINSAQTFEKSQESEAGKLGYLPYGEAQNMRVQQGYHTMGDKWLSAALDGIGQSAENLVPKSVVDQLNASSALRKQGYLLKTKIEDAIAKDKKVSLPEDFINSPYLDPQIKELAWYVNQPGIRKPQLDPILTKVNGILDPINALSDQHQSILDGIRSGIGSAERAPFPVEFQGKYYPEAIGKELNRANTDTSPTGLVKTIGDINNVIRPIMATLDASFMGVQGLVAALSNPREYGKAFQTLVTNGYGDYESLRRADGSLHAFLSDGGHWAARNDVGEYLFPSSLSKLPGVGKAMDTSNSWFTQFGNVLRMELYKSMDWSTLTNTVESSAKRASAVRTINLMTGFTPTNPSGLESAIEFAPRFFRSQLGLLSDAVTKGDISSMGAARKLGTMLTAGVALTEAMNRALGQETDTDPNSPNFMRVRVGGEDASVFGTWDTLARAITKSIQNPIKGVEYLASVKASPVMRRMLDVFTGSTLDGHKLDWSSVGGILQSVGTEATQNLPISAGQIGSDIVNHPGDVATPEFAGAQVLNFLGTKATPLSPSENMAIKRDGLAKSVFGKDSWEQLEPFQQQQLHANNGVDLPPKSDIAKAFAFHRDINTQFQSQQEKLDASLPIGKSWIDEYHNLIRERVGAFGQWAREHPDAAAKITSSAPKNADDAALQGFYKIFDTADKQSWGSDEITQAVSDFQDSISPAQQSYIDRNTGLHDTQRVKEYKAAQKTLRPYWDIGDTIFDRLKSRLPQGDQTGNLQEYTDNLISRLQSAGVPDQVIAQRVKANPVLKEITRATGQLRERYRQTHPQAQALLAKWYGYGQVAA